MRARGIKPGFYKNESLADCSLPARFLFPGLWMMADREGRLEDRPRKIKVEILPFDDIDVEPLLRELHANGFIERYSVGGEKFIQINNFTKHQAPHVKEKASEIPDVSGADHRPSSAEPGKGSVEHRESPVKVGASTRQAPVLHPLIPSSLIPSSLTPDSGLLTAEKIKTLGDLSIADDEAFKAFWAAYPRKTNQAAARKAWRKHGPGVLPVIFADIEARFRAGDWAADRKEFIPHPATYLNGSRWLDDIIPRGQSNGASRPIDKPRSPADRLRAIRAAEQAERESHGQVVDGDAEHFRPPVREQLRHDTIGRMDYDPGGDHPADDGRRN